MKHFLFNLTKNTAKTTQNAGGGASRKLMRHEDARSLAQRGDRYCIGNASDLSPRLVRLDSVSILSRQSDLDQVRAISVGLSARAWKHVAMILMVLTLGIGNVWGTAPATSAEWGDWGSPIRPFPVGNADNYNGIILTPSATINELSYVNVGGKDDYDTYNMNVSGKYADITLTSGVISSVSFAVWTADNTLLKIQFCKEATYSDDPADLLGDPYVMHDPEKAGSGLQTINAPANAKSARIYKDGSDHWQCYLYRLIVTSSAGCASTVTATFVKGAATSGSVESIEACAGSEFTMPDQETMSYPGYLFTGWKLDNAGELITAGTSYTMPAGGASFTAQWSPFVVPPVTNLAIDDGATLSSIPLSWKIPGICDLSNPKAPSRNMTGTIDNIEYLSTATRDSVTVDGDSPHWEQFGVGFDIPTNTRVTWLSFDYMGHGLDSRIKLWGGLNDASYTYWKRDHFITVAADETWYNEKITPDEAFWHVTDHLPSGASISQVAIYANADVVDESEDISDQSFSVRNVRYGISGQNDIDHVVLMRKEGSAATDTTDASATRLYSGTKSHYTDASDVTGKNYYYTVFAVHASGAVSTGVSTSLTLYTITYDAGDDGTGSVVAAKKTGGIDFTLSSSTFTRDGYTQDGWSTSDGGTKVYELGGTYSTDADVTLYPHWVADAAEDITNGNPSNGTISITDGVSSLSKASAGATVTITATPATGYNFTSWDVYKTDDASTKVSTAAATASTTFTMPAYAVTVNASFTAKTYTVTLNGNGGSGNTANVAATYNSSTLSSSITNPTKTGYIFDGWYSGTGGTGTLIISSAGVLQSSTTYSDGSGNWTNDGNVTLYAKWITILPATLNKGNVNEVSEDMTYYNTNYLDFGPTDAINTGRWAEWDVYLTPCNYSLSITTTCSNGYGWRVSIKDTELTYDQPNQGSGTDVTWNSSSDWDLTSLSPGIYTIQVTNHRVWSQPKLKSLTLGATVYTVTYDANGGTCGTESETVCGGSGVTLPSALGDGAFEGWYTSSDEEIGGTGDSYKPTADITLYAHWGASCPTPDAPSDFDLSSSTMTTATFAITDEEDAASYDLYYASGSPSTPTSETTATQSVTTKTPTITGLTASTEYKIWVRSVCDASHKSAWVALDAEGGAFTTPAPETYTITYNTDGAAEDQISDGEKTEGTNFTLSSTRYTKAGYRHVGWATSQGGSKVYDFGGTYSTDADLALYPAWVKLAVYNPDMSTEAKLTATIDAEFGGVDRWTLTTDANLVSTPKNVSSTAEENLTGEKYGLAFTPSWGSSAKYDLGAQTTLYQLTLDLVMGGNGSITALLQDGSSNVVKTLTDDIAINGFTAWEKKTFTYTYDAGVSNVRYIRIYGNGVYVVGLTRIKAEYAPTKTEIVLDSQSATSDGTTSVTATYGASTNLTSDITAPTKTNYIFGGYYTEESGAGTQLIDENGAWLASKTGYTDGSKNWQYANPDLTLYAKWTAKTTPTKYNVTAETIGSCNEASVTIILEDSEDGVTYELYKDGSATGTTKTGTGEALNWTGITAAGEYTIWTVEDETYASVQMDNDGYTTVTVIVKDDAELAYDDDEIEKNVGDAAFTNTLTNSHSVSVTYESSDEDVATVETDGEVTIVGAGSTTITASFAGDATYCAAEVSYTLTVYPVYTVTYIAMGGSCSPTSANTTTDLGKVTLPSASHDDYSSYTWVTSDGTEAGAAGDEYEPSGNISLYAKWSGSCASTCYTVTYHGNGATSGYVNDPVQYASGTTVYVSSSTGSYTRDGYEFNGWNTAANGSGTKVAYFTITGNTTLYAQWKYVINTNNTDFSGYAAAPTQYQDVKVTNGATLTITSTRTIHDLTIETGSTLNVSTTNGDGTGDGVTFTVNSLHLKGGWNSNYTKYDMPRVYIDRLSSLVKDAENPIVNFDISVDSRTYYPFAVPFRVKVSDINYADPTLAYYAQYGATGQYVIKEYDGERRAEKGPDHENNWKVVPQKDPETKADIYLEPGRGYIMTAISLPAYGGGVIRIPLSFTNAWTALGEQGTVSAVTKNIVPVTAYTGKATEGDKFANKGWNLLGVPFMSCYTTSDDMGTSVVLQGKFNFETGEWDGEDKVRYVNVPMHDFSEYVQVDMEDEKTPTVLRPGWCFFVQIGTTGNLTFLTADQAASSSLPIYAPKREKANMPTVKTGIILSDGEKSDQTTFLVSDKYSAMDYEINADLEKLFGNGYTLATYSLSGETRLAYNALSNADVANIIPIGYRAPAEGEYTFSINPSYAENGAFESVNLIDYETGIVTDLSQSSYTFSTERTQNDARFALNVVPRQETPTDLEDVQGDDVQGARVRKLLIEDKLFIIRDGVMYDATGKKVKGGAQ